MKHPRKIELLAPARNLECGMEAVRHGADAVYLGAPRFGARAAAGNPIEDIARLTEYAHRYNVRIYVTLNTLLHDDELPETERMVWQLYRAGVDALIVQDMGLTRLHLPPIPLHASTQTDNRTPEKVRFLAEAGFRQVVLARELSLKEIRTIHEAVPDTALEVFVHGALCVSYSGQCYLSQACTGRSANRGECAQMCRLPYDLRDADGRTVVRGKHLLSLKDMNRLDQLEELLDAGVTSLKIEGRLKDAAYVKNVTAAYSLRLNEILKRRPEYVRASSGTCRYDFRPQVEKSFSRGFTSYFLHGRETDIGQPDTPKSTGEEMGTVKEVRGTWLSVAGVKPFHNGDGVCFVDGEGRLQGFRVNRVENNRLYPQEMPRIAPRTRLYRNFDQELERTLARKSAERTIPVTWLLEENNFGFTLTLADTEGHRASTAFAHPKEEARTPQRENLRAGLSRLGNTPFSLRSDLPAEEAVGIRLTRDWFIPSSLLAEWRRQVTERLLAVRRMTYRQELAVWRPTAHPYPQGELTYLGNVMNRAAETFYRTHGVRRIAPAYERQAPAEGALLMQCKYCIRYALGWCPVHQHGRSPYREPYELVAPDGRRFRLNFDCKQCRMTLTARPES